MKNEIQKFFKGDVEDDIDILTTYSHDASLLEVRPKVIVFPKDAQDISRLVKWVEEKKLVDSSISVTVRSAGTCMSGGPLNDSIIVDVTRYMNRISSIKKIRQETIKPKYPNSKTVAVEGEAIVQPGCFYRDFEIETLKYDLLLPCYTASKSINAVGGMVGNNSAGELTLRYGKTEDYVKELKVIFADGNEYVVKPISRRELYNKIAEATFEGQVYKQIFDLIQENKMAIDAGKPNVSKNSAGYNIWNVWSNGVNENEDIFDLSQVIIGSQGTLGIVTEITFRLIKKPETSKLVVIFLEDLKNLGNIVGEILETNPTSLESYDDKTFSLAMKFFKDFVKAKGFLGLISFAFSFIPEFFMVLTGGIPKLILLVEYAGDNEDETQKKCEELLRKITHFKIKMRITKSEKEAKKYWDMRRDSFALLRKHVGSMRTAPFIDDIVVRPEFLPEFLPKLSKILDQYKDDMIYTIAGHAGNGNFHIIPLMDFNKSNTDDIIMELSDKVFALVLQYQGSISGEHNDGIIRGPFLPMMFGEHIYQVFQKIKEIFDPKNILNPNKKINVSREYLVSHIVKGDHPKIEHSS